MPGTLGEELRRIRELRGTSLREVEAATGISNAYLSQLETGRAERPSPHVLHTLATHYEVQYEFLMEAAGYLEPPTKGEGARKRQSRLEAAAMTAQLNPEEESQVLEFIEFLRARRRKR